MSVYDINGRAIVVDGGAGDQSKITVKRNSETLVSSLLSVAQTYLNKTSISYEQTTILDTASSNYYIDCSTYVILCLMGYPFEQTPYYTGRFIPPGTWVANSAYKWAIDVNNYKISGYTDGRDPNKRVRTASQIANWMQSRNQVVPLTNGFRDVLPGDVVFYGAHKSSTGDWNQPDRFLHINHVAFIYSVEAAPDTYVDGNGVTRNWDKDKYPYKHTIIDVGVSTPTCRTTHWLEEGQEDPSNIYANNVNTIAIICRPDLGAMDGDLT